MVFSCFLIFSFKGLAFWVNLKVSLIVPAKRMIHWSWLFWFMSTWLLAMISNGTNCEWDRKTLFTADMTDQAINTYGWIYSGCKQWASEVKRWTPITDAISVTIWLNSSNFLKKTSYVFSNACASTMVCTQVVHEEIYSLMKVHTPGQVYLWRTSSKVWFCPKCPESGWSCL